MRVALEICVIPITRVRNLLNLSIRSKDKSCLIFPKEQPNICHEELIFGDFLLGSCENPGVIFDVIIHEINQRLGIYRLFDTIPEPLFL